MLVAWGPTTTTCGGTSGDIGDPVVDVPVVSPPHQHVDMALFDLVALEGRVSRYAADTFLPRWRVTRRLVEDVAAAPDPPPRPKPVRMKVNR